MILFAMGLLLLAGISIRNSAAAAAEDVRKTMASGFEIKLNEGMAGEQLYTGYSNDESKWQPFFINGAVELVEGRPLESSDRKKAIISDELAMRNSLSIGDTISSHSYDFITGDIYSEAYDMEIIGLFHVNFDQDISYYTFESDILENFIFTGAEISAWDHAEYKKHYGGEMIVDEYELVGNVTIFINDPIELNAIMDEVKRMDIVDWEYHTVARKDQDYQTLAGPLQSLSNLSTLLMSIVAVGCFGIMVLLLTMWTRSRRTEIGIFTSMGICKSNLIVQFIMECLVIALIAFVLAALLAGPVTTSIGNAMGDFVGPTGSEQPYQVSISEGTWEMDVSKASSEPIRLVYTMAPAAVVTVLGVMLLVALISVLIATNSIARLKPREILTRR